MARDLHGWRAERITDNDDVERAVYFLQLQSAYQENGKAAYYCERVRGGYVLHLHEPSWGRCAFALGLACNLQEARGLAVQDAQFQSPW